MIEITGPEHTYCDGIRRREFIRAGFLGIAGLTLSDLLTIEKAQALQGKTSNNKSVILIWMHGGPSQLDTFDLKPDAPSEYRGTYKPISTNVPGIQISEMLPLHAKIMDKCTIHRAMTTPNSEHWSAARWFLTGHLTMANPRQPMWPSMGSIAARALGAKIQGMPPYVVMNDGGFGHHGATYIGGAYNPIRVGDDSYGNEAGLTGVLSDKEIIPSLTTARLEQRKNLLENIDTLRRKIDKRLEDTDTIRQEAFEILLGNRAREAFDVTREDPKIREFYGDRWGADALLARRLIEHGARFVTLNTGYWDDHSHIKRQLDNKLPRQDRAVHALITDLSHRGMLEDTLIIAAGEFGRTPLINADGGRDHWGQVQSILISGGKYKHGQVIGSTNARAEYPTANSMNPEDLCALVYHHLGIDIDQTFTDHSGRPVYILQGGTVPRELI
jgi:hypothetical protein